MHIKAENGLFVCAEQGGGLNGFERRDALIANRVEAREWETFTEEEHGDGTVSLQCANGMYVCAENGGGGPVSTNRSAAGPWERFRRFMSTDGRVQYLCFDGVHFLRVRTDLAQPVVDATGVAQGFTFRRLNTLASLIERARIRGSMFTARFPMSLGPRPGQPSNILAMVAMPFLPQSEQDAAFGAYLDRGYTHAVSGPIVDPGGNHGIYPPSDFTQADAFNRYLDVLERGSTRGLQWIHFVKPDNWTLDEVQRELEPLYRQPRAQELLGLVIPAGWEPGRFRLTNADWGAFFRWGRDVFPNSAIGIHMDPDQDAPAGGDDDKRGINNAQAWANVTGDLHFWLVQNAGYTQGPSPIATPEFVRNFTDQFNVRVRGSLKDRFVNGYAGWPTSSAWGPGQPIKVIAGEYAAFADFWRDWPESEARRLGDLAIAAGADGYLDGGTVAVP
ncbi:MAG: hypothetical protein DMG02_21705 [Acidobacteria bacterium]|nr:MAG: hypothetical protein DMG02_21705 [Acidobacteriota bacterium]PYQ89043.1 MAG: hypothetical protein DMG03_02255 [Acidobacteriota bacterium]